MTHSRTNLFSPLASTQVRVLAIALSSLATSSISVAQEQAGVVASVKGHGATKFEGHVTSVSFSHDGKLAVSADLFGSVKLWEIPSLNEQRVLEASTGPGVKNGTDSVKFSPDDRYIVCGSEDKTVWIWDAQTGSLHRRIRGHTEAVRHVFFFPDGKRGLSIDKNGTALAWKLENDDEPNRVELGAQPARELRVSHDADISSDGRKLVFAGREHTVLYDLELERELLRVKDRCSAVAISPNGRYMVIARDRAIPAPIELCDTTSGKVLWKLDKHYRSNAAFTGDSKRLLTCRAGDASLWEVKTGDELGRFEISKGSNLGCVACSSDNRLALFGTSSGQVILFRLP